MEVGLLRLMQCHVDFMEGGIHCKAKGGVGRKNCSLGSSVSRGADPRRAPRPDPRAGPRPDPRPKISGPLGPEIFGRGSGRGPARGSGRGARRGSAPRLTLLPWLQFFLPTPTFALQCYRLISTIQLQGSGSVGKLPPAMRDSETVLKLTLCSIVLMSL